MNATPKQKKLIYTLMPSAPQGFEPQEFKESLVKQFTNDRTGHVSEMRVAEAGALIIKLQELQNNDADKQAANRMRRKIISMAYEMNHGHPHSPEGRKAALAFIEGWCVNKGYLHKGFNQYSHTELPKLVSQFEIMRDKHLKGINE